MAKVIHSPGGTFNGKVGNLVFYQVGGQTYFRKAPSKQTKAQKQKVSPLKKISQDKMGMTQRYLKPLIKVIAFGFQEFEAGARRAYHACVSHTKAHCFVQETDAFYIDPALFKVSKGSLMPPQNASAEKAAEGITFTWKDNSWISSAKPFDKAFVVLYNPEKKQVHWEFLGRTRETGQHILALHPMHTEGPWDVYLAFSQEQARTKKRMLSDSVYLGKM
ncbi:DUF6266 family protein [Pararhodonellum marinum]|uniref:DUF6266 family protein n=1 Tax=Pararhodonellum marinum TaxID=2755358 RepID=UPI00188F2888|nr:DUF6266 family protein [Pararhodonellum marinum]